MDVRHVALNNSPSTHSNLMIPFPQGDQLAQRPTLQFLKSFIQKNDRFDFYSTTRVCLSLNHPESDISCELNQPKLVGGFNPFEKY